MFTNTLALAALAVSPALAQYGVNIYWGQTGGETLQSVCQKDGFEYVTLGFINQSPAQDPSGLGYPGSDFGPNCGSATYINPANNIASNLQSQCFGITGGIATCKVNQKKVLLSIGGVFAADSDYTVSTVQEGEQFADFLWAAYGPLADGYTGPRPFADNVVDGFDFDIETRFAYQDGYVALINRLRQHITDAGSSAIITAAPQCPLDPAWFDMETIITEARFDLLFVQFYNNPVCDYVVGNANPESFNFLEWQSFIAGTANAGAKLLVGLPGDATTNSAGSGYVDPVAAALLMQDLKAQPSFGGAMVWDANTGGANVLANGRNYYQNLHDALAIPNPEPAQICATYTVKSGDICFTIAEKYGLTTDELLALNAGLVCTNLQLGQTLVVAGTCPAAVTTTSSSTSTTFTSTSTTTEATTTTESTTTTASSTTEASTETSTATSSDITTTTEVSTSTSTTSDITTTTDVSTSTSTTSDITTTTDVSTSTSTTSDITTTTDVSTSTSTTSDISTSTEASVPFGNGTTTATGSSSSTALPSGTDTTTLPPFTNGTTTAPSGNPTGTGSGSSSVLPTITSAPTLTTSTITTTTVYTVTSCPATVPNCPLGHVTTEIVTIGTTVCPVGPATTKPPVAGGAIAPGGDSGEWTTSTVYTTTVRTITACPASVPNCPERGSVTTEVVAAYTTVCPVTAAGVVPTKPVGAGGVKEVPAPTTTTSLTSVAYTFVTVPSKPVTVPGVIAPSGNGNYTVKPTGAALPTGAVPVSPSGTGKPVPVTAGAGRNAAVVGLSGLIAAVVLAL